MSFENKNLSERVSKASEISKSSIEEITKALIALGIEDNEDSVELLDSGAAPESILKDGLSELDIPPIKLNAAVLALKGTWGVDKGYVKSPIAEAIDEQESIRTNTVLAQTISNAISENKPITQYTDSELVAKYANSGDGNLEAELIKRSRGNRFIVVPMDGNSSHNDIDVESTTRMIKKARKNEDFPKEYVDANGKLFRIFSVMEYSPENRIVELSPIHENVVLFDGYCTASNTNFSGITSECRSFLRLIVDDLKGKNQVLPSSELRSLISDCRSSGLPILRKNYPTISAIYDDLSLVDNLPRLKKLREPKSRDSKESVQQLFSTKRQY